MKAGEKYILGPNFKKSTKMTKRDCLQQSPQRTPKGWPAGAAVTRSGACDIRGDESSRGSYRGASSSAAPVKPGPAAMAAIKLLFWFVHTLTHNVRGVGDELDEATRERMRQRAEFLRQEMTRLWQEVEEMSQEQRTKEQSIQEQSGFAWGALLLSALQQWQFWAVAGGLALLFGLGCWLRKRSREPDSSGDSEPVEEEEEEDEEEESEKEDFDDVSEKSRRIAKRIRWPVQNLDYRRQVVEDLVGNLLYAIHLYSSNPFFPVLPSAIKVGSTFEGWSPREDDAVYRLLVPLKPPRGHIFHLELGTAGETPASHSRVRVELVCTCSGEQAVENTLCFLHHPQEELRRIQHPSLLDTLCTGPYLDVQKTAQWFQDCVSSFWGFVPRARRYKLNVLPSERFCKLLLLRKASRRTLFIEIVFGVRQGDSDVFLSSQRARHIFTQSTTWVDSYAVAEMRFFRSFARQTPPNSFHLKCLQLCAYVSLDTAFSTYTLKTVFMHLLNTRPPSAWRRRHFLLRLQDIMMYLRACLMERRLDDFFFGNKDMPQEILLPPAFETAEPLNLFQHLAQDPAAHAEALHEFSELQNRLTRLLYHGQ
ncbi:inositol 1,4,5-trisphosphate receptor-interacting protein-like 1 [Caloenas nicobarica]|uniref:inositol 1,4,5-trisphosphate receptor-interacting protein-like 1 n=1 Tax=Caloenas nicobarica TaxID=187106 RepID=UPI0032B834B6